mgnify:CR=1 FL=1
MFSNIYSGKKVLITGHTGFKGSWLTAWLLKLGAKVVGVSDGIPTNPSMFEELGLATKVQHNLVDIRDFEKINNIVTRERPDYLFHLAAQAIVSTSYADPLTTVTTNVIGTLNVLESLRRLNHECMAIIITSDKAYDNVEQIWGYKENDSMGGKDIYSGSKGAAELVIKSYHHSYFKSADSNVSMCVARAGNVIGGGDWAKDRIIVDAMNAWSEGESVEIRSPNATRPWQHVLEPLSGYLRLGELLSKDKAMAGEGFNFGPAAEQNATVHQLLIESCAHWELDPSKGIVITDNITFHEAGLLKLNCDKALSVLSWKANLGYRDTVRFTNEWYLGYYGGQSMYEKTLMQIREYETIAKSRNLKWTE